MKAKLFALLFVLFSYANAQEIKGGFHGGLPIGDLTDYSSFNIGLDISMLFEVYDGTKAGVATGYTHFFGKTVDLPNSINFSYEDFGFLPIAGTLEYSFTEDMYVGGDLGLAFALSKGTKNDISLYFQPKFGYKVTNEIDMFGSLKFIDKGTVIGVGFSYKFM